MTMTPAFIFVRVVALVAVLVALMPACGGTESPAVVVPLVVGLREPLATQVAEQAGLKPTVTYRPDGDTRKGFVFWQSIREGSTAHEGDTLTIRVSTGPLS
jgi:beta-lactam-binding protein with PASTA domain